MTLTGAAGVKMEGGREISEEIRRVIAAGIPVCGHLGLTPQSVNVFGGYGVRAKGDAEAEKLMADALELERLGCFAIVLEKIPAALAARVAQSVSVPVIGIGAGAEVDGQILVVQDMLGMHRGFSPKFMRRYGDMGNEMQQALEHYVSDVKEVDFPNAQEQY